MTYDNMAFDLKIKANSASYRMLSSFQATITTTTIIIVKHSNKLLLIFSCLYCLKTASNIFVDIWFWIKKQQYCSLQEDIKVVYGGAPCSGSSCSTIHQFSQLLIPYTLLFPSLSHMHPSPPPPLNSPFFSIFSMSCLSEGKGRERGGGGGTGDCA